MQELLCKFDKIDESLLKFYVFILWCLTVLEEFKIMELLFIYGRVMS